MFDFIRRHTRLLQLLLLVLILPSFVLLGVEGYSRMAEEGKHSLGSVDGTKITQAQFDFAQRERADRIRRSNPTVDAKLFDSAAFKSATLDEMVRERVLLSEAQRLHIAFSDEYLAEVFRTEPQLAPLRNPDGTLNQSLLAAQGMNSAMFLSRLRHDLTVGQVMSGITATPLALKGVATRAFDALLQQREIRVQGFTPAQYAAGIEPTDEQIAAFYKVPAQAQRFQLPERARIEYVVLDAQQWQSSMKVSEQDLQTYYEQNKARYTSEAERRASIIVIEAPSAADERAKAKARAQAVLDELRKAPARFAEIARAQSSDPTTAAQGGDLGFFAKGGALKPVEDAAFAMKEGEISNVLDTEFGFLIVQLTGQRGGVVKPFEEVRAGIEQDVRKQLAQRQFAEQAESFGNMVYEQADSLQPVADKYNLTLQVAEVRRQAQAGAPGVLGSQKLLDQVFAADALKNKRNTEAVEIGSGQLAAARVVQYQPAQVPPLADVKEAVRLAYIQQQASQRAVKAGEERLAELRKTPASDATGFGDALVVSRAKPGPVPPAVLEAALRVPADALPAHTGLSLPNGAYVIVRVEKLLPRDPEVVSDQVAAQQVAAAWSNAEGQALYQLLKQRHKVQLKPPAAALAASAASAP